MLSWPPGLFPILFINLTHGPCQGFPEILLSTSVLHSVHPKPDAILANLSSGFEPPGLSDADGSPLKQIPTINDGSKWSHKTAKHHLASVMPQHVLFRVTSALPATPRTSLSCCCWCNSSHWPGCYISSGATWKSQISNENQRKSLWSLLQNHTTPPNTGYWPSTS